MDFRQTLTARQLLWYSKPVRFPGWAWRQLKYLGLIATGQRPTIATVPMRLGHKMTIDMSIGFYSCGYAQIFRGGNCQIHAFEAVSKTHQRLQHNVNANGFESSIKAYPHRA